MRTALVSLALMALALPIAACTSEDGSAGGDAVTEEELTMPDMIQRVIDAGRSIDSYELRTTRSTGKSRQRSESKSMEIRVGKDSYSWWSDDEDGSWDEELTYSDQEYVRDDAHGRWKTREEMGWVSSEAQLVELEQPDGWDSTLLSEIYGIDFNQFLNAERLEEKTIGDISVVGFAVSSKTPIGISAEEIKARMFPPSRLIEDPEGRLQEFWRKVEALPDSLWLKQTIWIGADDYRIHPVDVLGEASLKGDVVESFVETQSYSRYNDAQLPGPLPDH